MPKQPVRLFLSSPAEVAAAAAASGSRVQSMYIGDMVSQFNEILNKLIKTDEDAKFCGSVLYTFVMTGRDRSRRRDLIKPVNALQLALRYYQGLAGHPKFNAFLVADIINIVLINGAEAGLVPGDEVRNSDVITAVSLLKDDELIRVRAGIRLIDYMLKNTRQMQRLLSGGIVEALEVFLERFSRSSPRDCQSAAVMINALNEKSPCLGLFFNEKVFGKFLAIYKSTSLTKDHDLIYSASQSLNVFFQDKMVINQNSIRYDESMVDAIFSILINSCLPSKNWDLASLTFYILRTVLISFLKENDLPKRVVLVNKVSVPILLKCFRKYFDAKQDDILVWLLSCFELLYKLDQKYTAQYVVKDDMIEAICKYLHQKNISIIQAKTCMNLLSCLPVDPVLAERLVKAEIGKALSRLMNKFGSSDLNFTIDVSNVIKFIFQDSYLAQGAPDSFIPDLLDGGVMGGFIEMIIAHTTSVPNHLLVNTYTLLGFAQIEPENTRLCEAVLKIIDDRINSSSRGIGVLVNLLHRLLCVPKNLEHLVKKECCEEIMRILHKFPNEADAFARLLLCISDIYEGSKDGRLKLRTLGVLDVIFENFQNIHLEASNTEYLVSSMSTVCVTIVKYDNIDDSNNIGQKFMEFGMCDVITNSMKLKWESEDTIVANITVISTLCSYNMDAQKQFWNLGIGPILIETLIESIEDVMIVEAGCEALQYFIKDEAMRKVISESGGCEFVNQALKRHGKTRFVGQVFFRNLCRAVSMLAIEAPIAKRLRELNILEPLREVESNDYKAIAIENVTCD